MKNLNIILSVFCLSASLNAFALDLDWGGQFRAESHIISNYTFDSGTNGALPTARDGGGYGIAGAGSSSANYQSLFFKLTPKAIVNDNISILSELWLGDPIFGFFGGSVPGSSDQRRIYSNQSGGSSITAHRVWGEFASDVGTFIVGRAPLNYGLGLVWNSDEKSFSSRYPSTGDQVRLVSRLGSFTFSPAWIKYGAGNTIGGACTTATDTAGNLSSCTASTGSADVTEYSIMLLYKNMDDDLDLGLNFMRRIAGGSQDSNAYSYQGVDLTTGSSYLAPGFKYTMWDLFFKKRFGKLTLGVELPVTSGDVGQFEYSAFAVATEANYEASPKWNFNLKAGRAPGQPNIQSSTNAGKYRAFYFHPDYHLGLIMFRYQFANFSGVNIQNSSFTSTSDLNSPYENPITNAQYAALTTGFKTGRWDFKNSIVYANAIETAESGSQFYNSWSRKFVTTTTGKSQESHLGWEFDLGTTYHWDDHFEFGVDAGLFFPGKYFAFSNGAQDNPRGKVFATVLRAGVNF